MSMSKAEMLKKSAELLDNYLDTVSAEEFLEMHESVKVDNGITVEEYFDTSAPTFNFMINGTRELSYKAQVVERASKSTIHFQFQGSSGSCSFEGVNDDEYSQIGEVA